MSKIKGISADLTERLNWLVCLGDLFSSYKKNKNDQFYKTIKKAEIHNPWFSEQNINTSIHYWLSKLKLKNINAWISKYEIIETPPIKVGIVMAGNFPFAGLHDLICVIISGNIALVKPSKSDKILIEYLIDYLWSKFPKSKHYIVKSEILKEFDKVIATGSNNTFRYFEYYFSKIPNILRKSRTSVAILENDTDKDSLRLLAKDIFAYFGLGCRNVSKLFIPIGFDIKKIIHGFDEFEKIKLHHKYLNNLNYYKTIKILNNEKFIDGNFFLMSESKRFTPPISEIYYEFYDNKKELIEYLKTKSENLQCIVSNSIYENHVNFGDTQNPKLSDYADNIDTIKFLLTN
tara:strand:+ start:1133 stop:2173 length:1041 start_codon:yes stop_codon:yes gene_type:complete